MGQRPLLLVPDKHHAWATDTDDAPPLAAWLGDAFHIFLFDNQPFITLSAVSGREA